MTLLVAGVSGHIAWMVADTAITGGSMQSRDRENQIKIVPSVDSRALIGFAGDQHHGTRLIEQARLHPSGPTVVQALLDGHLEYPSVDLAYAYRDEQGPRLVRISDGTAQQLTTLHIGSTDAFAQFQAIRHRPEIDPVPRAMSTLIFGGRSTERAPEELRAAVSSMLRLFNERSERDVGGFVVPYYITTEGIFLCSYSYSTSDPVLPQLRPGSALPHGTAQAGGFGLSVTEWCADRGVVVYWLQKPGGTVFVRTEGGYKTLDFAGIPAEFKNAALSALGAPVEIWFGETDHDSAPDSITVMQDQEGRPAAAIARHGRDLSMSVLNVETEFIAKASLEMQSAQLMRNDPNNTPFKVTADTNGNKVLVELLAKGEPVNQVHLDAGDVDALIRMLGSARASLNVQVAEEPNPLGVRSEFVVVDPAWRADIPPHPSLQGLMLRLRHLQFGWVSFLLPHKEAAALAEWLSKNALPQGEGPPSGQVRKGTSTP